MPHDEHPRGGPVAGQPEAKAEERIAAHANREITPADGSVAGSGELVCVFCAPCQRWIDCYDGIPPEVALDRHAALFH